MRWIWIRYTLVSLVAILAMRSAVKYIIDSLMIRIPSFNDWVLGFLHVSFLVHVASLGNLDNRFSFNQVDIIKAAINR